MNELRKQSASGSDGLEDQKNQQSYLVGKNSVPSLTSLLNKANRMPDDRSTTLQPLTTAEVTDTEMTEVATAYEGF
ncbi:hypothetical protein WJX77_005435 [Trebouxia sp. C0004]